MLAPLPSPPDDALALLDDVARLAGGARAPGAWWAAHAALVTLLALAGRAPAPRTFDAFVAAQPLVLLATCRSLALARAAAPPLAARASARGLAVGALFAPAPLAALRRWAPAAALWAPAAVSLLAAGALAASPALRAERSPAGGALREALVLSLGARALLAPTAVLLALARLLRAAAADFFARSLPGADAARAGAWLLPALAAGGRGAPAQAPDAAHRELFGAHDAGGLLHDARAAGAALAPAGAAVAAACALLAAMNAAAAVARPADADAPWHVAHAVVLVAVGLASVGVVYLLANAWLDPLARWLRREPAADIAREVAEGWGRAGEGGEGADAEAGARGAAAAHLEADLLKAWYAGFLAREGPLLQARLFGVAVDQKVLARAGVAWVVSALSAGVWVVAPRVAGVVE